MKTLHGMDGKIIGYIDDVNNELVIHQGSWNAILIKEGEGQYRNVTHASKYVKEKILSGP